MLPVMVLGLAGTFVSCKDDDKPEKAEQGEACDPEDDTYEDGPCAEGLTCEPVGTSDDYVCGARLEIRGQVIDSETEGPIEGALVAAFDETGAPVTDVAVTDADGRYVLGVSARRDDTGEIADNLKWTLNCSATDYQPFPFGVRPAIPVDGQQAQDEMGGETDGGDVITKVIENAATTIALIPLPEAGNGSTISGTVGEVGAGALVVAEGVGTPAPHTVTDQTGAFTLFNVPAGMASIRAYRWGVEFEPASVMSENGGEVADVNLTVVSDVPEELGVVNGSVNLVNPGDGQGTSVVLVPASVFNEILERGPVPFGLRDPDPPEAPTLTNAFSLDGVPAGTYKVLAAFENDALVRDPDESIAGTQLQEVMVGSGATVDVADSFKVTGDLPVIGPGRDAPERVLDTPVLQWKDDSSETHYLIEVFDALGNQVMNKTIVGVSGGDVSEPYDGDPLVQGMYYQFRVFSLKETPQGTNKISRTEDLRGVFVFGEEPSAGTGGTGG